MEMKDLLTGEIIVPDSSLSFLKKDDIFGRVYIILQGEIGYYKLENEESILLEIYKVNSVFTTKDLEMDYFYKSHANTVTAFTPFFKLSDFLSMMFIKSGNFKLDHNYQIIQDLKKSYIFKNVDSLALKEIAINCLYENIERVKLVISGNESISHFFIVINGAFQVSL